VLSINVLLLLLLLYSLIMTVNIICLRRIYIFVAITNL